MVEPLTYAYKELRPYQEPAASRMVSEFKIPLLFTRRAGKTPTTVVAGYRTRQKVWLIICPKNALLIWEDWIKSVFPVEDERTQQRTPYRIFRQRQQWAGGQTYRLQVWNQSLDRSYVNVFIMTYGTWVRDAQLITQQYDIVIVDEAKRIRNRSSHAFQCLKNVVKVAKYFWPLTGTPGITPPDFWTMFHLCKPKQYGSYWRFVEGTMYTMKNEWNRQEILGIKNVDQWRWTLNQRTIQTPDDIDKYLPPKQRVPVDIEMDSEQSRLYKELDENMMMELPDGSLSIASTSLTKVVRMRQLFICPRIIDPKFGYGSGLETIGEQLEDMDPHVVIYTPFKKAFPHIISYLQSKGHSNLITLYGGIDPEEQQRRIDFYRANRGIAICTVMYAQAFSLSPAKEAFFLGYEWNPEDNEQAEDRIRDDQTSMQPIIANYIQYVGTYDYTISNLVNFKRQSMKLTNQLGHQT